MAVLRHGLEPVRGHEGVAAKLPHEGHADDEEHKETLGEADDLRQPGIEVQGEDCSEPSLLPNWRVSSSRLHIGNLFSLHVLQPLLFFFHKDLH